MSAHLADILRSVTQSPQFLSKVAGEAAQVIADHIVEIVGIVAGFIAAKALSAFLAATPTGVGQITAGESGRGRRGRRSRAVPAPAS